MLVAKSLDYGSADLDVMAAGVGAVIEAPPGMPDHERRIYLIEAAIAFHMLSKVGRLFSAYKGGKIPSNDTWDDLTCYAAMAAKVRTTGFWIGD